MDATLTSRAGTSPTAPRPAEPPWGFCEHPFTQLNITADGQAAKCCADLYFDDAMGNVADSTPDEIWFGPRFAHVRRELLAGRRPRLEGCASCDYAGIILSRSPLRVRLFSRVFSMLRAS